MTFGVFINVSIDVPELCCPSVFLLVDREDEDEQEDDKDQVLEEKEEDEDEQAGDQDNDGDKGRRSGHSRMRCTFRRCSGWHCTPIPTHRPLYRLSKSGFSKQLQIALLAKIRTRPKRERPLGSAGWFVERLLEAAGSNSGPGLLHSPRAGRDLN